MRLLAQAFRMDELVHVEWIFVISKLVTLDVEAVYSNISRHSRVAVED